MKVVTWSIFGVIIPLLFCGIAASVPASVAIIVHKSDRQFVIVMLKGTAFAS